VPGLLSVSAVVCVDTAADVLGFCCTRFLQVRENWKESGNLSGQGKVRGGENIVLEKSGKMKNLCHQMSDFRLKCIKFDFRWAPPLTPLRELTALPQMP